MSSFRVSPKHVPPAKVVEKFSSERVKAAARLARKFWELSGKNRDYLAEAVVADCVSYWARTLADSTEEELAGVIEYALIERPWWIDRLLRWYSKDGYVSPFHRFTSEFGKLSEEYFAAKHRAEAIQRRAAEQVNITPTAASSEPKAAVNKAEFRIDKERIRKAKQKRKES